MATKKSAAKSSTTLPAGAPNPNDVPVSRTTGMPDVPATNGLFPTANPKPGYKTTEFWITIGTFVIALLAQPLGIEPSHVNETTQSVVQWFVSGAAGVMYIYSRYKLKKLGS